MPYYARKHQLEGNLLYHVLNRANARSKIFHDSIDYDYFIATVLKYSKEKEISIYHYCIMPNHYHLLLEIKEPEFLSSAIAGINKSYSVYYHKKFKTSGYLWQGRFKSKPIQKDRHILACGRYIERNPVVSGMVYNAEDYPYSSARYYVKGVSDVLICENPLYKNFGNDIEERGPIYKKFLLSFDKKGTESYNNFNIPSGDALFISKLQKQQGRYLPRRQGRIRNETFVP
ncbi:MAG: transposase [Parcubacteria group bacterium]|nr:transposase [Parcubacteria group bacterium]